MSAAKLQTDAAVLTLTQTCDAVNYAAGDLVGTAATPFWAFPTAAVRYRASGAIVRGAAWVDAGTVAGELVLHFYRTAPVLGGGSVSPGDAWGLTLADAPKYLGSLTLPALAEVGDAGVANCTHAQADADPPVLFSLPEGGSLYVVVVSDNGLNWSGGAKDLTIGLTVERW